MAMTGREKVEAALSERGTAECPAVICYEGIYVRDHWAELTEYPWWFASEPDLERQLLWRRPAIGRTGLDWFELPSCHTREERETLVVETRRDGAALVNRQTGEVRPLQQPRIGGWAPEGGLHSVRTARLPETIEEVDAAIPAAAPFDAKAFAAEGRADLARALLAEFGSELFPIRSVGSPLWECYGLWGFEGMMLLVASRPDLVRRACERHVARSIRSVRASAALGAAGIWLEDSFTDLVSPAAFADLNLPFLQQLVAAIREAGMKSIYYYCGNPADRWDLLLATGADALSLEESKKGFVIDIEEAVARAAGRCAVLGNLDAIHLLPNASEGDLRAEIARQLAAGRRNRGRFLMSIGSPVTPGTPVARVRRYCEMVRELGAGGA
ncbi:MAG: hypothetical protein FJ290_13320 [Planctomycetes bacterium]|nr:hypothetical protein [Planctomycetota bacterium]